MNMFWICYIDDSSQLHMKCSDFFLGLEKTALHHLTIKYEAVQMQRGVNDCGPFAVAFLTEILTGSNPARVNI